MAEVQAHGNYFEDLKIRELTGYSKEDYDSSWHQLKFVKHRNTREIQHYSQYDDVSGIQEEGDKLSKMYKSQEGRLPDY